MSSNTPPIKPAAIAGRRNTRLQSRAAQQQRGLQQKPSPSQAQASTSRAIEPKTTTSTVK